VAVRWRSRLTGTLLQSRKQKQRLFPAILCLRSFMSKAATTLAKKDSTGNITKATSSTIGQRIGSTERQTDVGSALDRLEAIDSQMAALRVDL
jgi:hypothetical protein